MRKLSPRILLIIAGVLSVLSAILVYYFLNSAEKTELPTKKVVVATVDIEAGKQIDASMLNLIDLPEDAIQEDSITDIETLVGRYAKFPIYKGEQITEKRLNTPVNANSFVMSIPDDKRAVTIKVDDIDTIAGFLRPGAYVDLVSVENVKDEFTSGKILFQNVLVLAVGKTDIISDDTNDISSAGNVTLALSADDAVRLRVAQQLGHISLMLRPVKPKNNYVLGADYVDGYKSTQTNKVDNKGKTSNDNTVNEKLTHTTYTPEPPVAKTENHSSKVSKSSGIRIIRGTEFN